MCGTGLLLFDERKIERRTWQNQHEECDTLTISIRAIAMANWGSAQIIGRRQWNERLCSLQLALPIVSFEAGQFVSLGLMIEGKACLRPYSLVNPPGVAPHEIFFNTVPDGVLSNRLFQLREGDTLLASPRAGGFFTLSQVPSAQHLWLCAAGTAIGPYLSMLRTPDPWESFERVILLHGVRHVSELVYQDLLQTLKERHPNQFDYFYSITGEKNNHHFQQRVPELLDNGELENAVGLTLDAETAQVMLCGSHSMVNACVAVLNARGLKKNQRLDPGQITLEVYQ